MLARGGVTAHPETRCSVSESFCSSHQDIKKACCLFSPHALIASSCLIRSIRSQLGFRNGSKLRAGLVWVVQFFIKQVSGLSSVQQSLDWFNSFVTRFERLSAKQQSELYSMTVSVNSFANYVQFSSWWRRAGEENPRWRKGEGIW